MLRTFLFPRFMLISILALVAIGPSGRISLQEAATPPAPLERARLPANLLAADYAPGFNVWLNRADMDVEGVGWIVGDSITLTVDDPGTAPSPDYTTSQIAAPAPWDATSGRVTFLLDGILEFEPGFTVTMSDGTTTKTLVEPLIQVTAIDPLADTVSGIATAGARVSVSPYDSNARRYDTADSGGNWSVDFSTAGGEPDESTLFDIQGGTDGNATISDGDGDGVAYEWHTLDPWFYVWFENWGNPNNGIHFDVHGYDWPANTPVTLTIDKLETTLSPDYTRIAYMEVPEWGGDPQLVFDTAGLVVHTGDLFHMTDGTFTVDHTITSLTVSGFDVEADTASGTAAPGSKVDLTMRDINVNRHVTTGLDGNWVADFSSPGPAPDEADTADLVPGDVFVIGQSSPGNPKAVNAYGGISIPYPLLPHIEARPGPDIIRAWDWPVDTELTLMVNDPATPQPVDYSAIETVVNEDPCNMYNCTVAFFLLGEFDLQPGHIISIWAGTEVRSYTVASFSLTNFDLAADTLEGVGEASHLLQVCVDAEMEYPCRVVTVDTGGTWQANFHIPGPYPDETDTPDLQPGASGYIMDFDNDGDKTIRGWFALYQVLLPFVIRG